MPVVDIARRALMFAAAALGLSAAAAATPATPIVLVHGNGDTAALWTTTLWRFESNGWPRERLHAVHFPYPQARDADDKAQPGRSSTTDQREFLAAEIDRVLAATGASQVVLMGSSRGGNAIRSFIAGGGSAKVSHAILGGTPNHGVRIDPLNGLSNEFNGAGPFLSALNNQGAPGVEITPGPRWMTIRSDNNDKFAQPDGAWLGAPGRPTGVGFDGPALRGADNRVLPGADHREVAFGAGAFSAAFEFITGRAPAQLSIQPEARVVLDGQVSGLGLANDPSTGSAPSNLPLAGATVEVWAVAPDTGERIGAPLLSKTVGADGRWGPLETKASVHHEFVVQAAGYANVHIYRQPFPRSSQIVHLRADRLLTADRQAGSVLVLTRPRGYFGLPRDKLIFDGNDPAPGIAPGVAGLSQSRIRLAAGPMRPEVAQFNDERIVGRNWPAADNHLVLLELH